MSSKENPGRAIISWRTIVRDYKKFHSKRADDELQFFESLGRQGIDTAIYHACRAITLEGKRYSHQNRIPNGALLEGHRRTSELLLPLLKCQSFHDVYKLLEDLTKNIDGLGILYTYDTALRIATSLGFKPEQVYLHSGTLQGAKLYFPESIWKTGVIKIDQLPEELQQLSPLETEDILCIFKDRIRYIKK